MSVVVDGRLTADGSAVPTRRRAGRPATASVGQHRLENVHTNGAPGRSTRATSLRGREPDAPYREREKD